MLVLVITSRLVGIFLLQKFLQLPFFELAPLFALSSLHNLLCGGHGPCESGSTSSCHARWVTSVMALAILGNARL